MKMGHENGNGTWKCKWKWNGNSAITWNGKCTMEHGMNGCE